jgi:hypothetical protein
MTLLHSKLTFLTFLLWTATATSQTANLDSTYMPIDSAVNIFNDQNYKLTLHVFSEGGYDESKKNATLTLTKSINSQNKIIFTDSLNCMYPWIQFKDFNNDGIKDILVFNTSSARSNWTHYLFLVNNKTKRLIFVKGFNKLLNPEVNKRTGVITSAALYGGSVYYSFYKINKDERLIKAGRGYEEKIK